MSKIVFISYPKSGRTWVNKIFEKYQEFSKSSIKQENVVLRTHLGYGGKEIPILKKIKQLDNPQYVLLTRDIPDTLVSFYHDEKVRKFRGGAKGTIDDFVLEYKPLIDEFYDKVSTYDFAYEFTYERMQILPMETILPFMNLVYGNVDLLSLKKAVDYCHFSKLSILERQQKEDMAVSANHQQQDFFKTRKGQVGSAADELKPETLKQLL